MVSTIRCFFLTFLVMITVLLRAINVVESSNTQNTPITVPGAYIVEFASSWTYLRTNDYHQEFYRSVAETKTSVTPSLNFTSSIFTGASFLVNNHDDLSAIQALPSVSAIWPVTIYFPSTPRVESIFDVFDLSNMTNNAITPDLYAPHIMTGVDKLHAQGFTGKNVSIAIVDSGVDYMHPALGGGFGTGYKFQFGYDFVGDNYTGVNLPTPGPYPVDCSGHGTHVSGIIGANAPMFTGVAPNATLGMYRVFGCKGGAADDVLIAAFLAAYQSGAQIITISLGSSSSWTKTPLAIVINRIAQTGVACTIAAGNSGSVGLFDFSSPATSIDSIGIGSVDSITTPELVYQAYFASNSSTNYTFQYSSVTDAFPFNISGYPLYVADFNTSNSTDECNGLSSNTSVLSNKIVLISPGKCLLLIRLVLVLQAGAQYILYSNDEILTLPTQTSNGVVLAAISPEQIAQWITSSKQGSTIKFYFPQNATTIAVQSSNNITGGTMSSLSYWSPTYELYIKPEVSAPGANILSTYPLNMGAYAVLSGTSMATPYIAGILGLYKSLNNSQNNINDYQTLKQILVTTANPVNFSNGTHTFPYLAPVIQQGGGLVNAFSVLYYTTLISPSSLALNDTVNFNQKMQFIINNTKSTSLSYILIHKPAATVYTLGINTTIPQSFPPDINTQYATATISPSSLIIPGKNIAVISVTFSRPSMLTTTRIPIYSGYINIQSSNNETFHLPYAGVACSMKEVIVTDFEVTPPYVSNSSDTNSMPNPINANVTFNVTNDLPNFNWRLVMGSSVVRLDVLGNGNQTQVAGINILGSVPDFPVYWVPRNYLTFFSSGYSNTWNGTLDNGVQVPAGNYKLLYRALKIFGDANNNNDYESWTSPMFGIVYGGSLVNNSSNMTINMAQRVTFYNIKHCSLLILISLLFIFNV